MNTKDYQCSIIVDATSKEAFENINRVSAWWAKNFEGHSEKLNDVFTVRFGKTFVTFKITEAIAGKRIEWRVTDCFLHWLNDKTEWKDTLVRWDISTKDGSTQIKMTHIGLTPGVECFENCKEGWDGHIQNSLFKLITQHEGVPA